VLLRQARGLRLPVTAAAAAVDPQVPLGGMPQLGEAKPVRTIPVPALILLAAVAGCVGRIYGIGGGSILTPILRRNQGHDLGPASVRHAVIVTTP
jgi:hypothetical protein